MRKDVPFNHARYPASSGQSVNELAIILGLVLLVGFASFFSMGPEIKKLFTHSNEEIVKQTETSTTHVGNTASTSTPAGNTGTDSPGNNNNGNTGQNSDGDPTTASQQYDQMPKFKYEISFDPSSQMAQIVIPDNVSAGTNTTSSLGESDRFVAQVETGQANNGSKSLRLAQVLHGLSNNEGDLKAKAYYQQLAQVSYYLGAVQGELDDVNGLELNPSVLKAYGAQEGKDYTNADALRDLINYSEILRELLQNQPAGIDPARRALAISLGREVFKLAQKYQFAHAQFLDNQGFATGENWSNDENCEELETCELNGFFGKSLKSAKNTQYGEQHKSQGWQYDQLVPYDELVKASNKVLAASKEPLSNIKIVLYKIEGLSKDKESAQAHASGN